MKIQDCFKFYQIIIIICLMIFFVSGCIPPDRWEVFERNLQQEKVFDALSPLPSLPPRREALPFDGGLLELSVEQAALLALSNNRDLRVQQLNPVIAGTFEQIERGIYDPELFAEFDLVREKDIDTDNITGDSFTVEDRSFNTQAGIRQKLPSGTDIEAVIEHERLTSDTDPEEQRARHGISITQALLRGFGPAVNLAGVRQAAIGFAISRYELRGFTEALLAEAEIAYWQYVLAKKEIEIFESSLAVTRQQKDDIEAQIAVGVLAEIDAAVVRAETARREQALIDAVSLLEERRLRLVRLISPDDPETSGLDLQIKAVSEPNINPEPITDIKDRLELAQKSRPDLNEARLKLKQQNLETIMTKNGLLPRLDFFAALGNNGFGDSFFDSVQDTGSNNFDMKAGLRFSRFFSSRTAKARDIAARSSRDQAVLAVENLQQMIALDVRLAINEVERTRQQIEASGKTRKFQEQTLYAEKQRFEVGTSTALLLAQAQRDLLASRINEVEAIINYRIALIQLFLAEGSLLERRGISLKI